MDGHGTHVSGTIGEDTNNSLSDSGMAYNVKIMPVKVCVGYWEVQIGRSASGVPGAVPADSGGCSNSAIAQGIRYAADNGAKVINISLGGDAPSQTVAWQFVSNRRATVDTLASIEAGCTVPAELADAGVRYMEFFPTDL